MSKSSCYSFLALIFFSAIIAMSTGVSLSLGPYGRVKYPYSTRYIGNPRYDYPGLYPGGNGGYAPPHGCPICDSSVYSYCSHKLVHDSCCCGDSYYTENSFECQYTDCSYIHANTCQESDLISTCCCDDSYKTYSPLYSRFFNKK